MKTILILHGWGSCAENWSQVRIFLENQGYKVLIPDLPGFGENKVFTSHTSLDASRLTRVFGENPLPLQAWNIDNYVEWVENYCEENNLSQIFLLGHSFGGAVATKFVLKKPEIIEKLFLVAASGIRKKSFKKTLIKKTANFFKKFEFLPFFNFFRKVFYKFIIKSDYLNAQKGSVIRETYLRVIKQNISDDFSKISVPTVLIWGKNDDITPLKHAYFIKEQISGAKLEILPNIKHNPHRENPELLVKKIIAFL
jgi:pimeloyl-ACP methyl ester carboxylesterase